MITLEIPHVLKRGRSFRYRRVVPPDCQKIIGRKNWIRTWKAGTPVATVERETAILAAKHDREIAAARGQEIEQVARNILADSPEDRYWLLDLLHQGELSARDRAIIATVEHGGKLPQPAPVLSVALIRDVERHGQDRDAKPLDFAVRSFIAAVSDKAITEITRADATTWINSQDALAPATIKRRLGALRAMVNRAYLDLEIDRRNPFEKHKINNGAGAASDRLPFSKAMLDKIDKYLASGRAGSETINILRMMRNTGCGPGEVGGLVLADVSLDSKVPYLWVRQNSLRGVKASVRDRQVPLVGEALDAARDALKRAQVRAKGKSPDDVPLFTSFRIDRGADSISAKLNKAIRGAGVPKSPRLTSYSYRHTIKEAMRSAGIADHIQRRLLGHAGHGVADRYGSPRARLSEARTALKKALRFLGDVDDAIYSETERVKG